MKLHLSLLLPVLTHSKLSCPDPLLGHTFSINDDLTMLFDIVLNESNITDGSILCARFESLTTGWIGFGISPTEKMIGAEAVIGVPADNTVKKYILFGKSVDAVTLMNEADQTLMDTSVTQDAEGRTTMSFTKYLFEDKYGIIPNNFINRFIWATGSTNELSYHGATRGNFGMDLLTTAPPVSSPPTAIAIKTSEPTSAPITSSPSLAVATSSGGINSFAPSMNNAGVPSITNSPMAADLFSPAPFAEVQTNATAISTVESPEETTEVSAETVETAETSDISVDGAEKDTSGTGSFKTSALLSMTIFYSFYGL